MWAKTLLLIFVFSFTFRVDLSFNQDLGRHIKLGEIISQNLTVPRTNLFSYTNPDFVYINTHWFFGVIAYFFSQTVGLQVLLLLKIIILILSVWITFKIIPKENQILLLPLGFIFLHVLRERLELRPEIFSFLFTSLSLFILNKYYFQKSKLIYFLPIIQFFWINTHIYFFVGLVLQLIFVLHLSYQYFRNKDDVNKLKTLVIIFGLSIFISLINPNGIKGILYPLNVNQNYGYSIAENQTMNLLESINFRNPNFLFVKIALGLTFISILVSIVKKRIDIKNILIPTFGMALALLNVRSFPYLVFLSLPFSLINLGKMRKNTLVILISLVTAFFLILESFYYLNGDYYKYSDSPHKVGFGFEENVKSAMDFVVKNNLDNPIYNNFDIGSYIIYKGYPMYKVYVDGRPEAYPKQFFLDEYIPSQSDYNKFQNLDQKWQFKTTIFSYTDQTPWAKNFLHSLVSDQNWSLVYIDDFMLVFIKSSQLSEKNIKALDLTKIQPYQFRFDNHYSYLRIGFFLISTNHLENGLQFISKSRQIFPNSPSANQVLGSQVKNNFFW